VSAIEALPAARSLTDLVVLVRLPSCIVGGASVLLGINLATGKVSLSDGADILGAIGIFSAVAAANVANDVLDIKIDALGKPSRPLPSGRLSVHFARVLSWAFAWTALAAAVPLGIGSILWMAALLALAVGYSIRFKNTVLHGNIVVALCASSPIAFGAEIVHEFDADVWVASGLAFSFMLAYETLKTIADHDSDAASGIHTFATEKGLQASIYLFRFLIISLAVAACAVGTVSRHPLLYLAAVLGLFVLPACLAIMVLSRSPEERSIRHSISLMRIAWFLGAVPLWLLR
jgi:geranylgeranylglycerol-phosphate geranylgeranyltransferase